MKSVFAAICLLVSVFFAGKHATDITAPDAMPAHTGDNVFYCKINGSKWSAVSAANRSAVVQNNKKLSVVFTYASLNYSMPSGFLITAAQKENKQESGFYIQPLSDDKPASFLHAGNNLYKDIYITYKSADGGFYSTHTSPGNFEITAMDTVHKTMSGRFNCILYNSTENDWLLVTDGQFFFIFSKL